MDVLLLSPEFIPIRGGIGRYLHEITKNMDADINLHILTTPLDYNKTDLTKDIEKKITIHEIGKQHTEFFDYFKFQLKCIKEVPKIIKKNNIDLIHSQSSLPDIFLPGNLETPIITTIHTTIKDEIVHTKKSSTTFNNLKRSEKTMVALEPALKILEQFYYNNKSHYHITVSKWMKNKLINEYRGITEDNINVIYNGVNTEKFTPKNRMYQEKHFPNLSNINCPKILFLSRWSERKGITYLTKSLHQLNKKLDVHYIFAGPNQQDKIDAKIKNCTFLGYIKEEKIPTLFSMADIFILPSLYENFPISMLEAMASGTAVIGTKVGGIPEMIENNVSGLLIEPANTDEIVQSIQTLVTDQTMRKELGKNARSVVKENFNWQKIAQETKKYYITFDKK